MSSSSCFVALLALMVFFMMACARNPTEQPVRLSIADAPSTPLGPVPEIDHSALMNRGYDSYALDRAFHYHAGLTGKFARDTEELRAYYPWDGELFGGYRLLEGVGPGAERNLMIERPVSTPWLVDALQGRDTVSPEGLRYSPVAGVKDGVERYVLHFGLTDYPTPEEHKWWVEEYRRLAPMYSKGNDLPYFPMEQHGITYDWREPKDPHIGALLQFRYAMVRQSIRSFRDEKLKWALKQNPLFWTNPYSNLPMTEVPISAPTAGDYSIVPMPDGGVEIVFHYVDYLGGVSTIMF